jgi:riboflavin kinase/FMN adenylyltransferase
LKDQWRVVMRAASVSGFPTANVQPHNRVIPRRGVYVTATLIEGQWRRSVTNIGVRPTFGDALAPSVETHVNNWSEICMAMSFACAFFAACGTEKKFSSVDEHERDRSSGCCAC